MSKDNYAAYVKGMTPHRSRFLEHYLDNIGQYTHI
jgi:hypothetical protein